MPAQALPHLSNIRGARDRISSAARTDKLSRADSESPFIDQIYGHSWSFTPALGSAVYGRTECFCPSPIDDLARGQFLRVPFRRVPIVSVSTLQAAYDLAHSFESQDKSIKVMWRGQHRQWPITRSEEESLRLYGEPSVVEPSLTPSIARAGGEFQRVFQTWSAILDAYFRDLPRKYTSELLNFGASYNYRLWAFATAQHYGLPSVGLDLTTAIDVALFFALHEMNVDKVTGETTVTRVAANAQPVVYCLGGFEYDLLDDAEIGPKWLQCERPKAQKAYFHTTGWGFSSNKAAERIVLAMRLRGHGNWHLPVDAGMLFPSAGTDRFLAFILNARSRFPDIANDAMLGRVYYVKQ